MYSRPLAGFIAFTVLLVFVVPTAIANPVEGAEMIDAVWQRFEKIVPGDQILSAARQLFWALVAISLVWTLGLLIIRQDIAELMMEMLRFVLLTGIFFWLLDNASFRGGGGDFVSLILSSFFQMSNGSEQDVTFRSNASAILSRGLNVFYRVIEETHGADPQDQLLAGAMAILVLLASALMAAQFLVALVMGWMLSYAGIFLLGFGGARWTSSIAVGYYKHVLAIGIVLLALSFIGTVATGFLGAYDGTPGGTTTPGQFTYLGSLLAALTLMLVLSVKVPQLLYTLVTGSPLGLFTGTATMAGQAIATGGSAVWASAMNALPSAGYGDNATGGANRPGSVMDAVQRSAAAGGGSGDAFHVNAGSDPFGVARAADPYRQSRGGSVFAGSHEAGAPSSLSAGATHSPMRLGERAAGVHPSSAGSGGSAGLGSRAREAPQQDAPDAVADRDTGTLPMVQEAASTPEYEAELGAIEASREGARANNVDVPNGPSPSVLHDLPDSRHGAGEVLSIRSSTEDRSSVPAVRADARVPVTGGALAVSHDALPAHGESDVLRPGSTLLGADVSVGRPSASHQHGDEIRSNSSSVRVDGAESLQTAAAQVTASMDSDAILDVVAPSSAASEGDLITAKSSALTEAVAPVSFLDAPSVGLPTSAQEAMPVTDGVVNSDVLRVDVPAHVPPSTDRLGRSHEHADLTDEQQPTSTGHASGGATGDAQLAVVGIHEQSLINSSGVAVHTSAEMTNDFGAVQDDILQSRPAASGLPRDNNDLGAPTSQSAALSTSDASLATPLTNDGTLIEAAVQKRPAGGDDADMSVVTSPGNVLVGEAPVSSESPIDEPLSTTSSKGLPRSDVVVVQRDLSGGPDADPERQGRDDCVAPPQPLDNAPSDDDE